MSIHLDAQLTTAVFHLDAHLITAVFHLDAQVITAVFHLDAQLITAVFHLDAQLITAVFLLDAQLITAVFYLDAHNYSQQYSIWISPSSIASTSLGSASVFSGVFITEETEGKIRGSGLGNTVLRCQIIRNS